MARSALLRNPFAITENTTWVPSASSAKPDSAVTRVSKPVFARTALAASAARFSSVPSPAAMGRLATNSGPKRKEESARRSAATICRGDTRLS